MPDLIIAGWAPGETVGLGLTTACETLAQARQVPTAAELIATVAADAQGKATFAGLPDGRECLLYGPSRGWVHALLGFTRQRPRLDALVPNTMASNSGDQVLQVQGRGLSISNELYFGSAGQREPVRPFQQTIITTIIKTNLWAPGTQPVWVVNAGIKSNVLTFTFT